jgi:hypothetical protein
MTTISSPNALLVLLCPREARFSNTLLARHELVHLNRQSLVRLGPLSVGQRANRFKTSYRLTYCNFTIIHMSVDISIESGQSTRNSWHLTTMEIDMVETRTELHPGNRMEDGTIFAGVSPDTGNPMYTTPEDSPLTTGDTPRTRNWKADMQYASKLDAHGHKDWRVPTKNELNVLFNNRAAIGGFNGTGSYPAGWYRSSTKYRLLCAWYQRFSDGNQEWGNKSNGSSLRCVR